MPAEFSRRSFLKYTALTAVAVAGSSLLAGCSSGQVVTRHAVGDSCIVLQVKSTLDSVAYDASAGTLTFKVTVRNGRSHSVQVNRSSFAVKAVEGDYYAYSNSRIKVYNVSEEPSATPSQLKTGDSQTYKIVASDFDGFNGDKVRLTFMPDLKYSEYSANWELDEDAFTAAEESPAETAAYAATGIEV